MSMSTLSPMYPYRLVNLCNGHVVGRYPSYLDAALSAAALRSDKFVLVLQVQSEYYTPWRTICAF